MKYYTTYLPYIIDDDYDRSYPSPEAQLLWRLDDLENRFEELIAEDAPYKNEYIYSDDDIRYALPEYFNDISKVERAIELAKEDLVNKYGLPDPDMLIFDESDTDNEICKGQLSMEEYLANEQPKAA